MSDQHRAKSSSTRLLDYRGEEIPLKDDNTHSGPPSSRWNRRLRKFRFRWLMNAGLITTIVGLVAAQLWSYHDKRTETLKLIDSLGSELQGTTLAVADVDWMVHPPDRDSILAIVKMDSIPTPPLWTAVQRSGRAADLPVDLVITLDKAYYSLAVYNRDIATTVILLPLPANSSLAQVDPRMPAVQMSMPTWFAKRVGSTRANTLSQLLWASSRVQRYTSAGTLHGTSAPVFDPSDLPTKLRTHYWSYRLRTARGDVAVWGLDPERCVRGQSFENTREWPERGDLELYFCDG